MKVISLFVLINVFVLFYFKYSLFMMGFFNFFGSQSIERAVTSIALPIGISFYTFQGVSYLIDVWRGDVVPERNIITFGAYKTFFPQLIAGPIVRYSDVGGDFHSPKLSAENFSCGTARFMYGLAKKVLIADTVAPIADAAFFSGEHIGFAASWIGALAFSVQIYFDFSGYSDMAIGLAQMFGIRFRENFNHPYASSTVTEFWRRWHISLSTWFRDYLYIPLGGNRTGSLRTYINLMIVFVATGIWHGAAWNFFLWGIYHGVFLIGERLLGIGGRTAKSLRLIYFLPVVIIGWTLFQVPNLERFFVFMWGMSSPFAAGAFDPNPAMITELTPQAILAMTIGLAAIFMQNYFSPIGPLLQNSTSGLVAINRIIFVLLASVILSIYILPQNFSPFLYFRF